MRAGSLQLLPQAIDLVKDSDGQAVVDRVQGKSARGGCYLGIRVECEGVWP